MDVMLNKISQALYNKNIRFYPQNQRVRCFAHIVNLAAKQVLENLDDNSEIRENESFRNIINKVLIIINIILY